MSPLMQFGQSIHAWIHRLWSLGRRSVFLSAQTVNHLHAVTERRFGPVEEAARWNGLSSRIYVLCI